MKTVAKILIILLLLMTACAPMLENEYNSITPLVESTPEPERESGEEQVASNYDELKKEILWLVQSGSEEGSIRLRNYNGNVASDVNKVCRDVSRNEPIGNYALDYIFPEVTQLVAEYDVSFTLTYRRTYEQIQAVESIGGTSAFKERFFEIMKDFGSELIFETGLYYNEEQYDFEQEKNRIYYANPALAQGMPVLEKKLYPESGLRRIVELKLTYPDDPEQLKEQARQTVLAAENIVEKLSPNLTDDEKALELYTLLGDICTFDHELYTTIADGVKAYPTTYDAFFNERVLPESYALAYKLLCDIAGIQCRVITGQRGADEHAWNLIQLDGEWYHVDLAADDMGDVMTYKSFLLTDSVMMTDYRWNTSVYPVAADGKKTYDGIVGEEEVE